MNQRRIPTFLNEADEATWWFENRELIASDLIAASNNRSLGQGSMARRTKKLNQIQKASAPKPNKADSPTS